MAEPAKAAKKVFQATSLLLYSMAHPCYVFHAASLLWCSMPRTLCSPSGQNKKEKRKEGSEEEEEGPKKGKESKKSIDQE